MGAAARNLVECLFDWDVRARQLLEVYEWALGERLPKPDYGMPLYKGWKSQAVTERQTCSTH